MLDSLDSCRDLLSLQSRNLNTSQQCPIQIPSLCPSPPICLLYDFTSAFSCAATPLSTGALYPAPPTPTNPEASGVFSLRCPALHVHVCLPVVLTHLHTHLFCHEKAPDSVHCFHLVAILKTKSWHAEQNCCFKCSVIYEITSYDQSEHLFLLLLRQACRNNLIRADYWHVYKHNMQQWM